MPLQEIYYIAEMVVGVAVIISIVFVAIELRQNTYIVRKSMAEQRRSRENWFLETVSTDSDFRKFHMRCNSQWDQLNDDEQFRAHAIGIRTVQSILDEVVAYFDGQIGEDEILALEWNTKIAVSRPYYQTAYSFIKDGYSEKVQKYWENMTRSGREDGVKARQVLHPSSA